MNEYHDVNLPPAFSHSQLKKLHLNSNKMSKWTEFAKLSPAFPNLQVLIAADNPLEDIPSLEPDLFPHLRTLSLNQSQLKSWSSLECLNVLCHLRELSVLNVPLGGALEAKHRRQMFVAHLPGITKLNKSVVTETEREAAERKFIREMRDKSEQQPAVYHQLLKKHGELAPLAEVDMRPADKVRMEIYFDDMEKEMEERDIKLSQTVLELKTWIAHTLLDVPVATIKLWWLDRDSPQGMELLAWNQKRLYTYRMHNGDELHVQFKNK